MSCNPADIELFAWVYGRRYGVAAESVARSWADHLNGVGDCDGYHVWVEVANRIADLGAALDAPQAA
ncbi:MAG: hypothetical protein P4M00_22115 [Azospirillaceae bacterium]|nr:hypothetical protein [Azospirillaceae bacterium]